MIAPTAQTRSPCAVAKKDFIRVDANPTGAKSTHQVSAHARNEQLNGNEPSGGQDAECRYRRVVIRPWRYGDEAYTRANNQECKR